jgi:hypothetical protein
MGGGMATKQKQKKRKEKKRKKYILDFTFS